MHVWKYHKEIPLYNLYVLIIKTLMKVKNKTILIQYLLVRKIKMYLVVICFYSLCPSFYIFPHSPHPWLYVTCLCIHQCSRFSGSLFYLFNWKSTVIHFASPTPAFVLSGYIHYMGGDSL
jgi:hypothetical protein